MIIKTSQNILTVLLALLFFKANAQPGVSVTNEERYNKYLQFYSLVKYPSVQPHWLKDGNRFWYADNDAQKSIYLIDPVNNLKRQISETDSLYKSALPPSRPNAGDVIKVFSPDKRQYAFSRDFNIWLTDINSGKTTQLTNNGIKDNSYSIPDAAWSVDGAELTVSRSDVRKVHRLPVVNYSTPDEEVEWNIYAKAGGAIEKTDLYIINTKSKQQVHVDVISEDCYLFSVGWRQDGSEYILMRLNRECNKLELLATNPYAGACRVILTEQQKTFVAGMDFIDGKWVKQCTLLDDGQRFIWMSERDGWNHLYLYNLNGKLLKQLTRGDFPVIEVAKVDEKKGWIYFKANAEQNLYYTNLYRVTFEGKQFKKLTDGTGQHSIAFSPSCNYFIDRFSDSATPPVIELRSSDGKRIRVLKTTDTSALRQTGWTPPENFIVKADDGKTDIYGILYKPVDFDPSKKYPVVEFMYGGPIGPIVPTGFFPNTSLSVQAQALAQLGYITVLTDGRGTTERSKAFQDAIYKNIGRYEIPDHIAAIKQLGARHSFMDLTRVGIFGHSWGGYFALRAMLTAPDFYKVGIASAPGDLTEAPEVNEPYMGLPQNNAAGYSYGSNPAMAHKLKGKLLFIHGASDTNAPFSTTVRMIDALIKAGKPYDLLLLPGQTHFYEGVSDKYVNDAVRRYFEKNL